MDGPQVRLYASRMIGKRFKAARLNAKMSLQTIADAMGVTPQAVAQWEKTNPNFEFAKVKTIATSLQVAFEWLEGQRGVDNQIEHVFDYELDKGRVPILMNKIEVIASTFLGAHHGEHQKSKSETLETTAVIVGRGFAFPMDDDSLSPDVIKNDILIFDSAIVPVEGDIVFSVEFYKSDGMFKAGIRKCTYIDSAKDGDEEFIKFPQRFEEFRGYTLTTDALGMIFAVMVEHRRLRGVAW